MSNVIIIGGGASGLVSAIIASKNGNNVTILERNNICGKKILLTGNGRCNFWNNEQNDDHYHSSNEEILSSIINENNKSKVLPFFEKLGLVYKVKNNLYYPNSNQASTISELLIRSCIKNKVNIRNNILVNKIEKQDKFLIHTNNGVYEADKIILSTGSCAYPKTGSDGSGYLLAKAFNHNIIKPLPALVQLISNDSIVKSWDGIRTDVKVSWLEKEEFGEIQLTNYGVSGICVMQLSSFIAKELDKKNNEKIIIDFLPNFTEKSLIEHFKKFTNMKIIDVLKGMLNSKLANILMDRLSLKHNYWLELNNQESQYLINSLLNFELNIIDTKKFDNAQIASGGISLNEINPKNMESKLVKGLYFTGEVLDCNGDCGGYNLGFAWITGLIAGELND